MRLPIYLDNHATTPVDPRVLEAMLPYFCEKFGNAASINHQFGWDAAAAVTAAREQVAGLLNGEPRGIVFTSGATEANNLALKGVLRRSPAGSHFITNAAEHKAVLDPAKRLQRQGYAATVLPVDRYGMIDPEQLAAAIRPETVLVSVMAANNEVGTCNPIAEIGALCRERKVLFHSDATQTVGKIPLDLAALPIDLLSLSAHKFYGPKGIGVLYVRPDSPRVKLEPQLDGGGHEGRLRSGTLPVELIVGLGMACTIAAAEMLPEQIQIGELRERLWSRMSASLPGLYLNGHPSARLAGNLNVSIERVDGEALMVNLKEIAVSSGSACTAADPEPSHVLRAMGVGEHLSRASVRFGIGRFNTAAEVDYAAEYFLKTVQALRLVGRS